MHWTVSSNSVLIYCSTWTETHLNRWCISLYERMLWTSRVYCCLSRGEQGNLWKAKFIENVFIWIFLSACSRQLAALFFLFLHFNHSRTTDKKQRESLTGFKKISVYWGGMTSVYTIDLNKVCNLGGWDSWRFWRVKLEEGRVLGGSSLLESDLIETTTAAIS